MFAIKNASSSLVLRRVSNRMVKLSLRSASRKAVSAAPLRLRNGARPSVVVKAEEETNDFSVQASEFINKSLASASEVWEKTADAEKPAIVVILISVTIAQIALGATIDVVDKLPFFGDFLELIGLAVAATYGYKYVTDPAERASVKATIDDLVSGVTGK